MRARLRRRNDRGAVAVEAALVLPLVMLLVFGMIEFGMIMRDYVSITAATRSGTRLASAEAGAGPCATSATDVTLCTAPAATPELAQDAADSIDRALTGIRRDDVKYLLVYQANSKGFPCTAVAGCQTSTTTLDPMPTSCAGYVNCNYFTWSIPKAAFRYVSGSWTSSTIKACINAQDSVGIYLRTDHTLVTGLFGTSMAMGDRSVAKFEPLSDDSCDSSKANHHP